MTCDKVSKRSGEIVEPAIVKRSVRIAGHATSVSLEPPFWHALAAIARGRGVAVGRLVERIDAERALRGGNLSSAIRVFVLECARAGELGLSERK